MVQQIRARANWKLLYLHVWLLRWDDLKLGLPTSGPTCGFGLHKAWLLGFESKLPNRQCYWRRRVPRDHYRSCKTFSDLVKRSMGKFY